MRAERSGRAGAAHQLICVLAQRMQQDDALLDAVHVEAIGLLDARIEERAEAQGQLLG